MEVSLFMACVDVMSLCDHSDRHLSLKAVSTAIGIDTSLLMNMYFMYTCPSSGRLPAVETMQTALDKNSNYLNGHRSHLAVQQIRLWD